MNEKGENGRGKTEKSRKLYCDSLQLYYMLCPQYILLV